VTRFATRIVERARGASAAVRPVLPSRFEAGLSARAAAEPLLETEVEAPARAPRERPPALAPAAREPPTPPPDPQQLSAPERRAHEPRELVNDISRTVKEEIHDVERVRETLIEERAPRTPELRAVREIEMPARAPPPQRLSRDEHRPSPRLPTAPAELRVERVEHSAPPTLFTPPEQRPMLSPARVVPIEAPRPREKRSESRAIAPPIAARPAQRPAVEPEPPVIHVSIGRIEVRAVAPAAPTPQRPRPPLEPRLSLDEYLRRRDGER
jgi:hypothetical protein